MVDPQGAGNYVSSNQNRAIVLVGWGSRQFKPAPADASGGALAADANGVSAPDASGVSNVVVAAPSQSKAVIQKEQAQPTPATVLTPEQLQADQVTNVQEAQKLVPDLQIRIINVRNVAINIRGLGQASPSALDGIEDGVGNLIRHFIGMPLGHRFGREGETVAHMSNPFRCFAKVLDVAPQELGAREYVILRPA